MKPWSPGAGVSGIGVAILLGAADEITTVTSLSGGAGWVGAGLLGAVLGWLLMIRMPAWDKLMSVKDLQIQTLIDSRDKLVREIAENHDKAFAIAEKDRRTDFQVALTTIADHCQRESEVMRGMLEKELSESSAAIVDLRRVVGDLHDALIRLSGASSNKKQPS